MRQHQSSITRHSLLTEHRSFAVEVGILAEAGHHSHFGAAEERRSHRLRGIAARDSRTCLATMCD
jgi:hypothetical protein